jgi:hypothetical protein
MTARWPWLQSVLLSSFLVSIAASAAGAACDPNYASPCIPIAKDVDCLGRDGNGPKFTPTEGPFSIALSANGRDIYGLYADGDGIACEPPPPEDQ